MSRSRSEPYPFEWDSYIKALKDGEGGLPFSVFFSLRCFGRVFDQVLADFGLARALNVPLKARLGVSC